MSNVIEKTNILRKEFLECDLNNDELVPMKELLIILDRKCKREFDRDVAFQLFERMNKDLEQRVSVDEFIKVWLQAEDILKQKIDGCKKYL